MRCIAISAECDPELRQAKKKLFANLVEIEQVEMIKGSMFERVLARRNFSAILVGGGSPCQGNSSLNLRRQGLGDERSWQPLHLRRIVEELQTVAGDLPMFRFLENVASAPDDVIEDYTHLVGGMPIQIDAADWKWVRRRRLFWLAGPSGGISSIHDPTLPEGFTLTAQKQKYLAHKTDNKQWPITPRFEAGFQPVVSCSGARDGKEDLMAPFTQEFFHPTDRVHHASKMAQTRFFQDNRRFPPHAYEASSLLWRDSEWRQPSPSERAKLMGIPTAVLDMIATDNLQHDRTAKLNSAIGNSFHVPSLMLALLLLFQLVDRAKAITVPSSITPAKEKALKNRVMGTVFDDAYMHGSPHTKTSENIAIDMMRMLSGIPVRSNVLTHCVEALTEMDLTSLQVFWVYLCDHGHTGSEAPPCWSAQRQRGLVWASQGTQRAAGSSSRGLDHLIEPGLGKELHIRAAKQLTSPFDVSAPIDRDMHFAIFALTVWRQHLPAWRAQQERILLRVLHLLQPLQASLDMHRVPSSWAVAASRHIAFMAFLTALLHWPDREQPKDYLHGFRVIGELPTTGLFRPIAGIPVDLIEEEFFGPPAVEAVSEILASDPPRDAEDIFNMTKEEIAKNYCTKFYTATEMNNRFGVGGWRPIHRFLVHQSDGKKRLIDDGKRGRHNEWSGLHETIFTIGVDLIPSVAAAVKEQLEDSATDNEDLEWADLFVSTTDLPDAFRGLPVAPSDQRATVIAIWHPEKHQWVFTVMAGCPFGLGSVVIQFNRYPALLVAAARRLLGLLVAAYFDDCVQLDPQSAATDASDLFIRVLDYVGTPPKPTKTYGMASHRVFLGAAVTLVRDGDSTAVVIAPREASRAQLVDDMEEAIRKYRLTPAMAAKMRGRSGWLSCNSFGRIGRLGQAVLKRLQYDRNHHFSQEDVASLHFHMKIVLAVPPRSISLGIVPQNPLLLYTDAEFSPERLPRIGILIFWTRRCGQQDFRCSCLQPWSMTGSRGRRRFFQPRWLPFRSALPSSHSE